MPIRNFHSVSSPPRSRFNHSHPHNSTPAAPLSLLRGDPCPGQGHQRCLSLCSHLSATLFQEAWIGVSLSQKRRRSRQGQKQVGWGATVEETANWSQVMETGLTKTGPEINSPDDIIMTSGDHTQTNKSRSSRSSEGGRIGASWLAHGPAAGHGVGVRGEANLL